MKVQHDAVRLLEKGCDIVATSSIFSTVHPKDKASVRKLVHALEHSQASKAEEVQMTRSVSDFTAEQIKKIFGDNDDGI